MKRSILSREHSFALVNVKLDLIEATSAWFFLLHKIAEGDPNLKVVHLQENHKPGELEVFE